MEELYPLPEDAPNEGSDLEDLYEQHMVQADDDDELEDEDEEDFDDLYNQD